MMDVLINFVVEIISQCITIYQMTCTLEMHTILFVNDTSLKLEKNKCLKLNIISQAKIRKTHCLDVFVIKLKLN